MKEGIHPKYVDCTITCACGNTFVTKSTKSEIKLEICSACHPFFTGKQKLMDSAGRIEKFKQRFIKTEGKTVASTKAPRKRKALQTRTKSKILSTSPKRKAVTVEKKKELKKEAKVVKEVKKEEK